MPSRSPALAYQAMACRAIFDELFVGRLLETQEMLERTGAHLLREGLRTTWSTLVGPAATRITETACPGDLMVMTSHGRTGPLRWPLGSTAAALLRRCEAPIIVLRAEPLAPVVVQVMADMPEPAVRAFVHSMTN